MSDDHPPARRRSAARPLVAGAVVLIPVIPIVIALLLSAGGGAVASRPATTPTTTTAALFKPVSMPKRRFTHRLKPPGRGTLVALVRHRTGMRSSPGGHVYAKLATTTEFGSPEALWVQRMSGRWLGVVSPLAGNGHLGWIPAADASLTRVPWELSVSLAQRRLTVLLNGKVRARYRVAVGAPTAPTPTGRFAVTDRLNTGNPSGPYGCCILALSAKAPHSISGWNGGNRIAIHSTPETWSIGQDVSHGCLRLTLPEGRWLLNHIPLGTPTVISS